MKNTELQNEQVTELPDREAMSIIAVGDNVAAPVNEANALNFYSDGAMAVADADQIVIVDQTDLDPDAPPAPADAPAGDESVTGDTEDTGEVDDRPGRGGRGGRDS